MSLLLCFCSWLLVVVGDAADVVVVSVAPAVDVDGPPLPPRIVDRSSLEKLELMVETSPPSKPVAPAVLLGS